MSALDCPRCGAPANVRFADFYCTQCSARLSTRHVPLRGTIVVVSNLDTAHITDAHIDDIELDARDRLDPTWAGIADAVRDARARRAPEDMTRFVVLFDLIARSYPESRCARRGLPAHTARGVF